MIISPWKSTVLRQHNTGEIVSELAIAKALGGLVADGPAVVMVTPLAEKVDAFKLPITSEEYGARKLNDNGAVFVDGRSFLTREKRSDVGFVVSNQTQADFIVRLGELTALWVKSKGGREDFYQVGDLAAQTYISWVSGLIGNKLGADEVTAREIQIITGLFYLHLFHGSDEIISQRGKEKAMKLIQRWTRHPIQLIISIVESVGYMDDLGDYVNELKKYFASNTRIAQVSAGFITMGLWRSWKNFGAEEICGAALEYPPAFLAMVEAAANMKVWRQSQLGNLVQRLGVNNSGLEAFSKSMEILAGKAHGRDGVPQRRASFEAMQSFNVSDAEISAAEQTLGVTFSPDYVNFLRTHGVGTFGHHEIAGLGVEGHLNVVTQTQEVKSFLKPGRYVIENVGVDSVFIVADAGGKLYQASPNSEKPMNITFGQYLKDIMAGKR